MRLIQLLFVGLIAGVMLSCQPELGHSVSHRSLLVIVADVSTSSAIPTGQTIADLRCPQVLAAAQNALTISGLRRLDILILATGSKKGTGYEAKVIVPWRSFSPTSRLFGKKITAADQREQFLRELDTDCRASLKEETSSPIYFAVERAMLSLNDHAQELSSRKEFKVSRTLVALTDLRENGHEMIRMRLLSVSEALRRGKPIPTRPATLPVLSTQGLTFRVCGLAEYTSTGSADDLILPAAIPVAWREVLPEATFDAACPSRRRAAKDPEGAAP